MARNYIYLYGKNSVAERLKANPSSIKKILAEESFDISGLEEGIGRHNIGLERLPSKRLSEIMPAKGLQGIIAKTAPFEYAPFDRLLNGAEAQKSTLVFLDRINDPQNLGVIIRTLACFGGFAAVIPRHEACEVNETVLHVASGGENYVSISRVTNLSTAVIAAKKSGYWIMGAVVSEEAESINDVSVPFPLGLVLGSEGGGIRYGLQRHLDIKTRIPMTGARLSFNVNIACAIFCHEISKRREKPDEKEKK